MDRYGLTKAEAAQFMGLSLPTLTKWVRDGRVHAERKDPSKPKSPYIFTRQACIAALNKPINTVAVSEGDMLEEKTCPSSVEVTSGTRASRCRVGKDLKNLLGQRTRGRHRSCTTKENQNSGE
nr:DNA-binding protein [Rahnella aceris]